MTGAPRRRLTTLDVTVMVVCGVVGWCAVMGFVLGVVSVLNDLFMWEGPEIGVGFVTGLLLSSVSPIVAVAVLPAAAPPGSRATAYGVASAIFGGVVLLVFVASNIVG